MSIVVTLDVDLEWTETAACCGEDPERFFPGTQALDDPDVQDALAVCAGCPVRAACLEWALTFEGDIANSGSRFGIYGGMTPRQRTALARPRRKRLAPDALAFARNSPTSVVRAWAISNGVPVPELGNVSDAVRRAYAEATYGRSESA